MSRELLSKSDLDNERRKLMERQQMYQFGCDHKNAKGPTLDDLKGDGGSFVRNSNQWSDTAVKCNECGSIFEARLYTTQELNEGLRAFYSIGEQIKLMGDLHDDELADAVQYFTCLMTVEKFVKIYNEMRKRLGKGQNDNGHRSNSRGSYGINSNLMNSGSRRY